MTYAAGEARQELLDEIARAIDELAVALAALGAAHEQLDDATADRLEAALFQPVQAAYAKARRAHAGFSARMGLPARTFAAGTAGAPPSAGVKGHLAGAVGAAGEADATLADLQDSLRLVEVGDAALRADVADVRAGLDRLAEHAEVFLRVLGR